mgnify:CR=1 FL=1
MKQIFKILSIFLLGGISYMLVEVAYKGKTHWTMLIVGGICFLLIGAINEIFPWEMPLALQCILGGLVTTLVEFIAGCIINIHLGWDVWDYSDQLFNIMGQVCLLFFFYWVVLAGPAIIYEDYIRYCFGEEKPHYTLFKWRKKS